MTFFHKLPQYWLTVPWNTLNATEQNNRKNVRKTTFFNSFHYINALQLMKLKNLFDLFNKKKKKGEYYM